MKVPFKIIPERTLHLNLDFTEKDADNLIGKLFDLNQSKGEIFLQINSSGGNFPGAQKIYDNIVMSPNSVIGLVVGDCFSGATVILQGCSKRYASKNARLLIHHVSYPIRFTLYHNDTMRKLSSMIKKELDLVKTSDQIMVNIFEEKLKIPLDQIIKIMDKAKMMSPEEALEIGLIDQIV